MLATDAFATSGYPSTGFAAVRAAVVTLCNNDNRTGAQASLRVAVNSDTGRPDLGASALHSYEPLLKKKRLLANQSVSVMSAMQAKHQGMLLRPLQVTEPSHIWHVKGFNCYNCEQ